ncbi:uncharacterized [Tachysurus ichikawai]
MHTPNGLIYSIFSSLHSSPGLSSAEERKLPCLLFINHIRLIRSAPARCTRAYSMDSSHIKYASAFKARPALPNPLTDSRPLIHPTLCCQSKEPELVRDVKIDIWE